MQYSVKAEFTVLLMDKDCLWGEGGGGWKGQTNTLGAWLSGELMEWRGRGGGGGDDIESSVPVGRGVGIGNTIGQGQRSSSGNALTYT